MRGLVDERGRDVGRGIGWRKSSALARDVRRLLRIKKPHPRVLLSSNIPPSVKCNVFYFCFNSWSGPSRMSTLHV